MKIGVDASNISSGGGVTHLVSLLGAAAPEAHGVTEIVVWAPARTLALVEDRHWLTKRSSQSLEKNYLYRGFWQRYTLGKLARQEGCDLLFVPGGTFTTDFRPVVTMSRNMLPFELRESARYGFSLLFLKMLMLRRTQSDSFRRASGVIFLSEYARDTVLGATGTLSGKTATVPHGVDSAFFAPPRPQRSATADSALRLLYVSPLEPYKHQWHVVEAVANLRSRGIPVEVEFVGPTRSASRRLEVALSQYDEAGRFAKLCPGVPHKDLPGRYQAADVFVYASSCENLPNILLEAMASGLPIACSDRGPMPEVLGNAGIYFDPEEPTSIADAIGQLIASPELRTEKANAAFERVRYYSWERCASETLSFLTQVCDSHRRRSEPTRPGGDISTSGGMETGLMERARI